MTEDQPSYEEAREELVDVVRRLETGGTDLEESLALWERGERLARICQAWLDGARKRLDAAIAATDDTSDAGTADDLGPGGGTRP
jgi:exodeoxyribonuclease VII small subunit